MVLDKRKNYYVVLDTETANGLDDPLMYDCGWAVIDKKGHVYASKSFVNRDIFCNERDLMRSSYYANKIPRYVEDLRKGTRTLATTYEIKNALYLDCKEYNVKAIIAHNARFDYMSTNKTQRWVTKSKYRYFFPYGIPIWDTMKMAQDVIATQPSYQRYCIERGYVYGTTTLKPRVTAEILHRYLSGDSEFVESHTGLEDVMIEKDIFVHCLRQHKKMRKNLWEKNS